MHHSSSRVEVCADPTDRSLATSTSGPDFNRSSRRLRRWTKILGVRLASQAESLHTGRDFTSWSKNIFGVGMQPSGTPALEANGISLRFGGLTVLNDVSLEVGQRQIVSLIGPNGAGKSSLVNCITGFYRPQRGTVTVFGEDVSGLPPQKIAKHRVARTYQNIELFDGMSVLENLLLGRHMHMSSGPISGGLWWGKARNEELREREVVEDLVDFLELESIRNAPVSLLSYGQRKRVDLGRALAQDPHILILDEPMAGMNVEEKEDMVRFILELQETRAISIVLIEHDMGVVMDISDRVAVLDFGQFIAMGSPDEVKNDPAVIRAYVGGAKEIAS
ncbi:ABC transporter ATP-binding protein [Aeromicrobium piscarium]|nr:ABC transporter ATP-binding protein [Aeromicrobium piscarium]